MNKYISRIKENFKKPLTKNENMFNVALCFINCVLITSFLTDMAIFTDGIFPFLYVQFSLLLMLSSFLLAYFIKGYFNYE